MIKNILTGIILVMVSCKLLALDASEVYQRVSPSTFLLVGVDDNGQYSGHGSAVAVTTEILATNCHVVANSGFVKVKVGKNMKEALVFYHDSKNDICLLKVNNQVFQPAPIRDASELKVGEQVYAIGNPEDPIFERSITQGIISKLHKSKSGYIIQTDADIAPGSSGGGLFDKYGNLIGITYLRKNQLGFAIPAEIISKVINSKSVISGKSFKEKAKPVEKNKASSFAHAGTFGQSKVILFSAGDKCFIQLYGRDPSGNIISSAIWSPRFPKNIIIFPTMTSYEKSVRVFAHLLREGASFKSNSRSYLIFNNKFYELQGPWIKGKGFPVLLTEFSQSLNKAFMDGSFFIVMLKNNERYNKVTYGLWGFSAALAAYHAVCEH